MHILFELETKMINDSQVEIRPSEKNRIFYQLILFVGGPMILIGVISSILTIIMFLRDSFTPRSTKFILQTLSATDLLFLISVIFYIELKSIYNVYPHVEEILKPVRDHFVFVDILVMVVNISEIFRNWLTVLIGIERYLVTCHPLKLTKYQDTTNSHRAVIFVSIFAVILRLPMLIRRLTIYSETPKIKNLSEKSLTVHSIVEAIFQSFLPVSILLFCFIKITKALKESKSLRKTHQRQMVSIQRKTHITRMLIIIIILFTFCNTPNIAVVILTWFNLEHLGVISMFCWFFSILYSSSNFFIYIIYMRRYRHIIAQMFGNKRPCCYENTESSEAKCRTISINR